MQSKGADFFNLYNHGFIRVAVGIPEVRVADPAFNAARTVELMQQAAHQQAMLVLFPELGLSSYSCEDLFHQQALLEGAVEALHTVRQASASLNLITVVGLPLQVDHLLFNCAVALYRGRILGVAPKTYPPNYREFYELRQFAPAAAACSSTIDLGEQHDIPFGEGLLFHAQNLPCFTFFLEICEDLWVPIPPSCYAALAGATVLLNLSASNITIGKHEYRHSLVANQSARCLAAYLYTAAGTGESTTDLAWDGHAMVYENGTLLAESQRFQYASQLVLADVDVERLAQERMRQTSFGQSMQRHHEALRRLRTVRFAVECRAAGGCCACASTIASPMCQPIPPCATAAVMKPITFKCRGWSNDCRAPASPKWSWAFPADWTRPTPSLWRHAPWICWVTHAPIFWPIPCPALPPAAAPWPMPMP